MMFGGTFDPGYILTVYGLPSQIGSTQNKRNAALLQKFMGDTLGVHPARGFVKFLAIPEDNLAYGGRTAASEMSGEYEDDGNTIASRRSKAKLRLSMNVWLSPSSIRTKSPCEFWELIFYFSPLNPIDMRSKTIMLSWHHLKALVRHPPFLLLHPTIIGLRRDPMTRTGSCLQVKRSSRERVSLTASSIANETKFYSQSESQQYANVNMSHELAVF
jgi:hypothetical protein